MEMHSAKGIELSEITITAMPLFRSPLCAMPYALPNLDIREV